MNGWSYDYMLALDSDNCEKAKTARNGVKDTINAQVTQLYNTKDAWMKTLFEKYPNNWKKLCAYANWAYVESIELKKPDVQDSEQLYETCQQAFKIETTEYNKLEDGTTLKGVSTNDLRNDL